MSAKLLSIAIITYNHEKFIARCLDSVLSQQTNFDFEIIVAEDVSTDQTRNILLEYKKLYPNKIELLLQKSNIGAIENARSVLQMCNSKYISYLDGDDFMLPGKLQKQVDFLEEHPQYSMVVHGLLVYCNDKLLSQEVRHIDEINLIRLVRNGQEFSNSTKMFKGEYKDTLSSYYSRAPDYLWNIELAIRGPIAYLKEPLLVYNRHTFGMSKANSSNAKIVAETFDGWSYAINYAKDSIKLEDYQFGMARINYLAAIGYLRLTDYDYKKFKEHIDNANLFIKERLYRQFIFSFRWFPALIRLIFIYVIK